MLRTCKHGFPRIINKDVNDVISKFYYVLLPVYMVNIKYKDNYYTFAMNGQTGKFVGNIPLDKNKVVIYSILSFIICFGIIELIIYLIYCLGGK